MRSTPFEFIQYVALEQHDTFAVKGHARALAGFAKIEEEAEEYGRACSSPRTMPECALSASR